MSDADTARHTRRLDGVLAAGLFGVSTVVLWGFAGIRVSILWVWLGLAPAVVGYLLVRRPAWSLGLPLWCGLTGGAGAVLLGWTDGAGGFTWPPGELTLAVAYAALLLALAGAVVGSLRLLPAHEAMRSVPLLLLAGAPWAVLAYLLLDGTDVLGPAWAGRSEPFPGGPFLVLLTFLVGLNGAAVGYGLCRPRPGFTALLLLGTFLMLGVGFFLVRLGLETEDGRALTLPKWAAFQLATVWFVGLGHWIVLSLSRLPAARARREEEAWPLAEEDAGAARVGTASPPGRTCAVLATVYVVLVVYGLLVPLEYKHRPFEEAVQAFAATPYLDLGVGRRADLVANLVLFVPLAFLAMAALTREDTRPGRWVMAGLTVAGAIGLTLALEFLQLYFPPRTVSWNDVLAECAGAVVGTALWLAVGGRLARWWRRVRTTVRPGDVARHLLSAYAVALFLYQLFPYDVILSAEELVLEAEQGKIVLHPLAGAGPGPVLALKMLALVPIGFWAVVRWKGSRRPVLGAVTVGAAYAMAIEVLQVFVFSRFSSTTDVLLGTAGALVGGVLATRLGPAATKPWPRGLIWRAIGWLIRLGLAAALAAVVVRAKWAPMEVHWPEQGLTAALAERIHVPFYHQYYNSEFEAVAQLLRDMVAPAVLAMLLVSLLPAILPGRRVAAAAAAAAVAVGVELGQVVFPPHTADMTTAVLAAGGAVAGVYLYGPFVKAFIRPGGADDTQVGLEDPT